MRNVAASAASGLVTALCLLATFVAHLLILALGHTILAFALLCFLVGTHNYCNERIFRDPCTVTAPQMHPSRRDTPGSSTTAMPAARSATRIGAPPNSNRITA
jgi:hypothetical protein